MIWNRIFALLDAIQTLRRIEQDIEALRSTVLDLQGMKARYEALIATYEESMRIVTDRVEKKLARSGKTKDSKRFPLFQH